MSRKIDDPKHAFRLVPRQGVIERRGQVQRDHGSREHARADNRDDATTASGGQDEEWSRHERRQGTDPVAHAIGDFLSEGRLAASS
jgi:hypothetical protein